MSALTLGMDANRGMYLDRSGNIVTKQDEDAMADLLTQRLSSLLGEFRFDKAGGVPYMQTIYQYGSSAIPTLQSAMINILMQTEHVVGVAYLDIAVIGDELRFEASVATEYGQVFLQQQGGAS